MEDPKKQQQTMRAIVIEEFKKAQEIKINQIPVPQSGQVLVKVEASPINPSDLGFLKGTYAREGTYPLVPGFEGSGVVVENGGGIMGWNLVGKRVAITGAGQYGCYGEYCLADALTTMPLPDDVSFETGACSFVNPLTVIYMLETAKDANVKAVVSTAAASQLGRMMVRYFQNNGVRVINIVRRPEQVEILKKVGADIILNSNDENFLEQLKTHCTKLNAQILYDAVGGELTGKIMKCMPKHSKGYVYGALSLQPCQINIEDLLFSGKSLHGYWLSAEIKKASLINKMMMLSKLKGLLNTQLKTQVAKRCSLEDFQDGIKSYLSNMSEGKVLLMPGLKPAEKINEIQLNQEQYSEQQKQQTLSDSQLQQQQSNQIQQQQQQQQQPDQQQQQKEQQIQETKE